MNKQQFYRAISVLIIIAVLLSVLCLLLSGILLVVNLTAPKEEAPAIGEELPPPEDIPTQTKPEDAILSEAPDAGIAYQDALIFFGESTTAHLSSRGVLSGGTDTKQVWKDSSGTKTLSSKLLSSTIIYPETGENLTITAALASAQPQYMVLSFGLNNISGFISNKSLYVDNYKRLILAIQEASPDTKIILQSVYPIASHNTTWGDSATVNQNILTLNDWLIEIAAECDVKYADTASVLRGEDNALLPQYDNGDGIHLSTSAYNAILHYLRTHPYL